MQKTYKFRLYPTKANEKKLQWTLDQCRYVYNYLLEKKSKSDLSRWELSKLLPKLKIEKPELQDVYARTLQCENNRLHSNIFALSRLKKNGKKVGRLHFKDREHFRTFTYNQSGFKIIESEKRLDILHLSKIGNIPIRISREINDKIKQISVTHYPSGKWFALLSIENKEEIKSTQNEEKIGIDLGLENFVYDSEDNRIDHPRCFDKSLRKLAREQRRLSRKVKGSKNWEKQKIIVSRTYEKMVNQRVDFLHKLSRKYVDNYGLIAVENLKIVSMVKNKYLARSILDAAWSQFIQMIEYKAESAGVQVVKVDPKNTTQICSQCGSIVKKSLSVRTHKCSCGFVVDRDFNSALNILNKAVGQELPELKPVETEPLLSSDRKQVQFEKQESP